MLSLMPVLCPQTGKYYSVNFPLQEGIDDNSFESIFKPVLNKVRIKEEMMIKGEEGKKEERKGR